MQAPVAGGRQERQLVAGRYRLAFFHRGDENTEAWRALDEVGQQMVTLEFLRHRASPGRERFLAEARRIAAIERPTVIRVAAIHDDDTDGTFIVFEHLVPVPVLIDPVTPAVGAALSPAAVARANAPAATAALDAAPAAPESVLAGGTVTVWPPPDPTSGTPTEPALPALIAALRARDLSRIDGSLLRDAASEIKAAINTWLAVVGLDGTWTEVRTAIESSEITAAIKEAASEVATAVRSTIADAGLEGTFARARAAIDRADVSPLNALFAQAAVGARRVASVRPHLQLPAPRVSGPARVRAPRVPKPAKVQRPAKVKAPRAAKVKAPRAPRAPGRAVHVRWGRVLSRGLSLGLLAAVVIALPPETVTSLETGLRSTVDQGLRAVGPTQSGLARASFDVPPLSAYGAAFESQAPYPKARPNDSVEWVIALRNTGSVGWYRGIDGAQASLALADGTSAAVQSTAYVGPGQVGWFVVHFHAPSEPGAHKVYLSPRIDGRGQLPDLGIYVSVTVTPNP